LLPVVVITFSGCPTGGGPPPPPPGGGGDDTCAAPLTMPRPKKTDVPARQDGGTINTSCIGSPEQLQQSAAGAVQGGIAVCGLGGDAKPGIKVAFYDDTQDPKNDTPQYGEVTIGTQNEATTLNCAGADAGTAACLATTCEKGGAYVATNIPVHIPLTMR